MAKIHEEIIVIKFSKLIKETDDSTQILENEIVESLASVAEELVGTGVIVEAEKP